jgi:hypothetical protein
MKKLTVLGIFLTAALMLSSCRKNDDETTDLETQSATDSYLMDANINDAIKEVDWAANENSLGKAGPTVTVDTISSPKRMVIDYGSGTLCVDGKLRAGRLLVGFTGRYRDAGTVITIIPDSFYQNGNKLEGFKTITNNGRNSRNNLNYTIEVKNAKLTTVDGKTRTWTSTRNREWIGGENTKAFNDDVYQITGTAYGTSSNRVNFAVDILQPLQVDFSCQYRITAGEVEVKPIYKLTRTINYGSGTCDNNYTVKIGNRTFTVYR